MTGEIGGREREELKGRERETMEGEGIGFHHSLIGIDILVCGL